MVAYQGLIRHDHSTKTHICWLLQQVWLALLCSSASRCRGYLHAKSLGTGGEYLSYVWLLLAHAGMETLPERLQRMQQPQLPNEDVKVKQPQNGGEDVVAAPSASQGTTEITNEEESTTICQPQDGEIQMEQASTNAAPSASQGEGAVPADLDEVVTISP